MRVTIHIDGQTGVATSHGQPDVPVSQAAGEALNGGAPPAGLLGALAAADEGSASVMTYDAGAPSADLVAAMGTSNGAMTGGIDGGAAPPLGTEVTGGPGTEDTDGGAAGTAAEYDGPPAIDAGAPRGQAVSSEHAATPNPKPKTKQK
ncbi:MAG: hypothetical protein ABI868_13635 [Acidobacteriota bacterium]